MAKLIEIDDRTCEEESCSEKATQILLATVSISTGSYNSIIGFYCKKHAKQKYEDQEYKEDPEYP